MRGLYGTHPRQLDERGRFVLPAKLREKMSGTVHVTISMVDESLVLYTDDEWQILEDQLRGLPTTTDQDAKDFVDTLLGGSDESEIDKQGRITIDTGLLRRVGITKDIVLVGNGYKLLIWDAEKYEEKQRSIDTKRLAASVSRFGLNI